MNGVTSRHNKTFRMCLRHRNTVITECQEERGEVALVCLRLFMFKTTEHDDLQNVNVDIQMNIQAKAVAVRRFLLSHLKETPLFFARNSGQLKT